MQSIGAPKVKYGLKCTKHKEQMIHSYLLETVCPKDIDNFTHTLLCSECIFEKALKESQFEIIPTIMQEIKGIITSTKTMIFHR